MVRMSFKLRQNSSFNTIPIPIFAETLHSRVFDIVLGILRVAIAEESFEKSGLRKAPGYHCCTASAYPYYGVSENVIRNIHK